MTGGRHERDLAAGRRLREGFYDALARGGVLSLYEAVDRLDRAQRILAAVEAAADIAARTFAAELLDYGEEPDEPRRIEDMLEADAILLALVVEIADGGLDAARQLAATLTDCELREVLITRPERDWFRIIEERQRRDGKQ